MDQQQHPEPRPQQGPDAQDLPQQDGRQSEAQAAPGFPPPSAPVPPVQPPSPYQAPPAYQQPAGHQAQPPYQQPSAYQPPPAYQQPAGSQAPPQYQAPPAHQQQPAHQPSQTYQQPPAYQQQPAYQQPQAYQQSPAYQQSQAAGPAQSQNPASPSAPPAAWQGDHATYLQTVPTAVYQAPSTGGYAAYQQAQASAPSAAGTRRSTWSLITGIVGLVISIFVGWGFPLSIAAIVLGVVGRRREPQARGRALTGIVTGAVGLLCSIGWLAYSVVVIIGYVNA